MRIFEKVWNQGVLQQYLISYLSVLLWKPLFACFLFALIFTAPFCAADTFYSYACTAAVPATQEQCRGVMRHFVC